MKMADLLSNLIPVTGSRADDIHIVLLGQSANHVFRYSLGYRKLLSFYWQAET